MSSIPSSPLINHVKKASMVIGSFHRNFPQRQATVILTGFLSPVFAFRLLPGNLGPFLSSRMCYHPDSGMSVVLLPELLPSEVLADGAPL
jgi:hypothetical protein